MAARGTQSTTASSFPIAGLLVLAGAIFVSVTSEFLPTGLLPDMASELKVSESRIGLLITIFAATVVVSTTPLAALTRRFSRKSLVIVVLIVIASGAVLAALAPTYEVLVAARVIGGLAHGLFWAVVGAYSAHLVPKHQIGRAVAITSGGATAAFVLGVPLGTALGHLLGWRLAFAAIGGVILVLAALVLRFLPPVEHRVTLSTGEIAVPIGRDRSLPGVIVICLVIVVIMMGQNVYYTYIAPWLIHTAHFDASSIALVLFLYGGAGAVGLALAGAVADRFSRRGFVVATAIVLLAVLALALFPTNPVVVLAAIVVWGIAFGGLPAMLQTRMLHTASARIRDLAAALLTTSFNLAIGGGALVGGILLDRVGLASLPFVNLAFLAAGIVLSLATDAWLSARANRAHPRSA
ncbi:MFS transporter [Lacisediminihabitans sp.]|uniref:MFS transporter n=1 Tax=Lacisediminihabitans sp. TaxID=2787631 RepID=UPI002F93E684